MLRSRIANLAHIRSVNAMDETLLSDGSQGAVQQAKGSGNEGGAGAPLRRAEATFLIPTFTTESH